MSPIRLPNLKTLTSKFGKFRRRHRLSSRTERPLKYRSLQMDPLEERQLLSVAPADWDDTLINNPISIGDQVPGDPSVFEFARSSNGGISPYNFYWSNAVTSLDVPYADPSTGTVFEQYLLQPGNPESQAAR